MDNKERFPIGSLVRVRDDVYNRQNGISNAESYSGKIFTISKYEYLTSRTVGVRFLEDARWWWSFCQIEPYVEPDFKIDDFKEIADFLEGL